MITKKEEETFDELEIEEDIEFEQGTNSIEDLDGVVVSYDRVTIYEIINRMKENRFIMDPSYQRRGDLWTPKQKGQLIESIILGLPIPPIFVHSRSKDYKSEVVDGLQRLTTIKQFANGEIKLSGLNILVDLNGLRFDDLDENLKFKFNESSIYMVKISADKNDNIKYEIFKRMNTGSVKLNPQEIRNAIFKGELIEVINNASDSNNFLNLFKRFENSIFYKRMKNREFLLRVLSISKYIFNEYKNVDSEITFSKTNVNLMNDFLENESDSMNFIKLLNCELEQIFSEINYLMGEDWGVINDVTKHINISYAECIFVMAILSKTNWIENNFKNKTTNEILLHLNKLKENQEFNNTVTSWTTNKSAMEKKYNLIISEVLK